MISHVKPYIELARLDKPAGFLLLFWPCGWAIILADFYSSIDYYTLAAFLIGAVALRSAGCVVNDILDRKIDAKVERTKNRPLASGRLTTADAVCLLFLLLVVGLFIFLRINIIAELYAVLAFLLALIYPLMKRFFKYPQFFLGLVFGSGALVAWAAVNVNVSQAAFMLYIGCIFWVVGYDTIYAHQDKKDDEKIGVGSAAISFGKYNKMIIMLCFATAWLLICSAGYFERGGMTYIFCLPALIHSIWLVKNTNFDNPDDCMKSFKSVAFIGGLLYFAGLYLSKIIIL